MKIEVLILLFIIGAFIGFLIWSIYGCTVGYRSRIHGYIVLIAGILCGPIILLIPIIHVIDNIINDMVKEYWKHHEDNERR